MRRPHVDGEERLDETADDALARLTSAPAVKGAHGKLIERRGGDDQRRTELARLLQVAAAIEHSLMVQYLYGAYSIDAMLGAIVGAGSWQDDVLITAREEMGHLMSVQNALRLIGAAPNWNREDAPWDGPYYPFPMVFEPFTLVAVEKFVYAEMDPAIDVPPPSIATRGDAHIDWDTLRREIDDGVRKHVGTGVEPHHVGTLFRKIHEFVSDPTLADAQWFDPWSYPKQASWDAWGKGYRPHPDDPELQITGHPANVIVAQMGTRTELLDGLRQVAHQGEAPHLLHPQLHTPSHFDRFLQIYLDIRGRDLRHAISEQMRHLPTNPTVDPQFADDQLPGQLARQYIDDPGSRRLAELSNLRYRLLITNLGHAHRVAGSSIPGVRATGGFLMQRAFADMFNVKTLAGLLFRAPLTAQPGDPRRAGPPFALPDQLGLSAPTEGDVWALQLKLTEQSIAHCQAVLAGTSTPSCRRFVAALLQIDTNDAARIRAILAGKLEDGGGS